MFRQGFQSGGRFRVDRPSTFVAGEGNQTEYVQITPDSPGVQNGPAAGGGVVIEQINIYAQDEAVGQALADRILEETQDAGLRGLDVTSSDGVY